MKRIFLLIFMVFVPFNCHSTTPDQSSAQWTIIGAGPAGIITVGLLLDLGVDPQDIVWVDPEFNVGRMGKFYETVPGNTRTFLYIEFINACKTFQEINTPSMQALQYYEPHLAYPLEIIINPLRDITQYMCTKVRAKQDSLTSLDFINDQWYVGLSQETVISRSVVLATGSHPRNLHYPCDQEIPLDMALNKDQLAQQVTPQDTIAVVGSAHSAVLVMKYLSELPVGRIINFYLKPLEFVQDMGAWFLLTKSLAGDWAKNVLEKNPPAHLIRLLNTPQTLSAWLPICTKIIYACGFDRNELPAINGTDPIVSYHETTGVIAPRLFGIGIAFPEKEMHSDGSSEYNIGLLDFMSYAQKIIPAWLTKKNINHLAHFAELFSIRAL